MVVIRREYYLAGILSAQRQYLPENDPLALFRVAFRQRVQKRSRWPQGTRGLRGTYRARSRWSASLSRGRFAAGQDTRIPAISRSGNLRGTDGRAVSISLWNFYKHKLSLEDVVRGRHRFGTWADHVRAWAPETRPNTLLLKYEDIVDDLTATLDPLGAFLKREIRTRRIPRHNRIAGVDERWVRKKSD